MQVEAALFWWRHKNKHIISNTIGRGRGRGEAGPGGGGGGGGEGGGS